MSDLAGNPEDRFYCEVAQMIEIMHLIDPQGQTVLNYLPIYTKGVGSGQRKLEVVDDNAFYYIPT